MSKTLNQLDREIRIAIFKGLEAVSVVGIDSKNIESLKSIGYDVYVTGSRGSYMYKISWSE